jgi:hypothetical protein
MSRRRTNTYIVVVMKAVLIGIDRVKRTMAPRVQQVSVAIVRVTGCDGAEAQIIATHLAAAALTGGALALASSLTVGGVSSALKLTGELTVGAIAVHAAIRLVQARSGALHDAVPERALVRSALGHVVGRHALPVVQAVALLRQRRAERAELLQAARDAGSFLLKQLVKRAALRPAKRAVPGLGNALALLGTYQKTLDSARYVHQFALTAAEAYPALPEAA